MWLKNISTQDDEELPAFSLIAKSMAGFRQLLNEISQKESGDKTLRVDEEEFVLSHHNGASTRE